MKLFITSTLVFVGLMTMSVHAVATPPSETVWITPADAGATDPITLNAFVYNDTTDEATTTVVFTQGTAEQAKGIATVTIIVPANTAKIATTPWTMPERSTLVTATVSKALTKTKKEIPTLVGVLGTSTIGGSTPLTLPDLTNAKGFVGKFLARLEDFRVNQAKHYAGVLAKSKAIVNDVAPKDIADLLVPDDPNAPTPTTEGEAFSVDQKTGHTAAYANMVFATAAHSFFDHKAAFYITLVIITLFLLRFIIGRFF